MFSTVFKKSWNCIKRKSWSLFGFWLLSFLIIVIVNGICGMPLSGEIDEACALYAKGDCASFFAPHFPNGSGALLPIAILVIYAIQIGVCALFLNFYRGKEINNKMLFSGFKPFWRNFGALAWKDLWLIVWLLIPVAGIVMVIIKSIEYRFVPFILVDDDKIHSTDALKQSQKLTHGHKSKMFWMDVLFFIIATFVIGIAIAIVSASASLLVTTNSSNFFIGFFGCFVPVLLAVGFSIFWFYLYSFITPAFYEEILLLKKNPELGAEAEPNQTVEN